MLKRRNLISRASVASLSGCAGQEILSPASSSSEFAVGYNYSSLYKWEYEGYQNRIIQKPEKISVINKSIEEPSGFFFPSITQYLHHNPATSLLVGKNDVLLVERYRAGLNQGSLFNSYSASKGVVSIICGIFFNLGILRDENIKISMLVDEFKSTALSDVSLKDLLSMRSGISFDASYNRANDTDLWQSLTFKRFGWSCCASNQNSSDVFPSRRVIEKWSTLRSQPGSRYYYSSFDTYLLCYVLEQTLGSSLAEFCQNHLWNPLGAEANAKWLVDDSGLPVGGEGLFCSSRDYMKIAFLMINNGTANGKKIVTEDWVSKMLKPYSREYETGSRDSFGFNTWLFQNGTYAFLGARGQGIFFNKQKNVALVHTGVEPHRSTGFRSRMFELWSQISSAT